MDSNIKKDGSDSYKLLKKAKKAPESPFVGVAQFHLHP